MPDFTFADGVPLPASVLNNILMNQVVITCTSSTTPSAPQQGQVIYQTDTDSFLYWNGTAWQTQTDYVAYTPIVTGATTNPTLGTGSTRNGLFHLNGRKLHLLIAINWGTAATNYGAGTYSISIPTGLTFPALTGGNNKGGQVTAICGATPYGGYVNAIAGGTTLTFTLWTTVTSRVIAGGGGSSPGGWNANDTINIDCTFPIA